LEKINEKVQGLNCLGAFFKLGKYFLKIQN